MKKQIFENIALLAGGSHYPNVGGQTLHAFADLLIDEVIRVVERTSTADAYTTYDSSLIESTKKKIVKEIQDYFTEPR